MSLHAQKYLVLFCFMCADPAYARPAHSLAAPGLAEISPSKTADSPDMALTVNYETNSPVLAARGIHGTIDWMDNPLFTFEVETPRNHFDTQSRLYRESPQTARDGDHIHPRLIVQACINFLYANNCANLEKCIASVLGYGSAFTVDNVTCYYEGLAGDRIAYTVVAEIRGTAARAEFALSINYSQNGKQKDTIPWLVRNEVPVNGMFARADEKITVSAYDYVIFQGCLLASAGPLRFSPAQGCAAESM